MSFKSKMINLI